MINGISIPVLTPYKFYPATDIVKEGVNFQNVDNTSLSSQEWMGVYPNCFVQPVPRYWNDYSPGVDFQVYHDSTFSNLADLRAYIIDLNGNELQALTIVSFFGFSATITQLRIYANTLINIADGYYRISIKDDVDALYYSEIIEIKETFDGCYPLEYSNFENDFGLIFNDTTYGDLVGKILIPMRMFAPIPSDERESYQDDNGVLTTLRSLPNRVYQMESMPVATWFAEKIKLIFNCSDLTLNKQSVNTNETPEIELVSESDLMTINSEVQLNDFPDNYLQDDQISTITELLTGWTESTGAGVTWDTFTNVGKNIDEAIFEDTGTGTATSNSFTVVSGSYYLIKIVLTTVLGSGDFSLTNFAITIQSVAYSPTLGTSYILHKATAAGSITAVISCENQTIFTATCSIKKIS